MENKVTKNADGSISLEYIYDFGDKLSEKQRKFINDIKEVGTTFEDKELLIECVKDVLSVFN